MEEEKAHRLYMNLKEQGAGATFNKHGLGFNGAPGPAPSPRPTQLYDGAPRGPPHPGMRPSNPEALGPPRQPGAEAFPPPGPRPPFGLPPSALPQAGPPFARPQMQGPPHLPGPPPRAAPPTFHHPGMAPQMPMRPQQMPPQMMSPTGPPPGMMPPQLWRPAPPRAPPGGPWPGQQAPPGMPPGMPSGMPPGMHHQYAPPLFLPPQGQPLRPPPPDQLPISTPPPAAVAQSAAAMAQPAAALRAGAGPMALTSAPLPPPESGATHQPQQHTTAANGGGSSGGGGSGGRHMDLLAVLRAWTAHKSENGQVYYFNPLTNDSSWVKPEGFTGGVSEAVPTSQLRVPGTAWFEIHCEDGRKYYYNDKSEETSWTVPPEVAAVKQHVQEAKIGVPTSAAAAVNRKNVANGLQDDDEDVTYTEEDIGLPPLPQEPHSPAPPMPDADGAGPPLPQLPDPEPPKSMEELASDFHDLLAEQGVTPFSRWERELPKLVGDARYQALATLKERKQLFEDFCKASPEHRSRARSNGKAAGSAPHPADGSSEEAANAFRSLLLEAACTARPLEENEAEEGESSSQTLMQADTTFDMLKQRFGDDPRWQACNESRRRNLFEAELAAAIASEQLTAQKSVEALAADFRALLVSSGINGSSRWSRSKDSLAKDSRFKAVAKDSREQLFRDFVAEQKKEEEAKIREKRDREKKEQAAAERLKREAGEAEKRQKKAAHSDAVANYLTLLNEAVKDPNAHWSDWRSKLQRDPQGRGSNPELDAKEAEGRFRDHVENLQKKAASAFTDLLEQVVKPLLPGSKTMELPPELRSFSKAEKLWPEDPCASKLSSKERERLWRRFVEDILLERDDPEAAARRLRLSGRTRASERERPAALRDEQQPDKAYEREYLAHDRKRLRRD